MRLWLYVSILGFILAIPSLAARSCRVQSEEGPILLNRPIEPLSEIAKLLSFLRGFESSAPITERFSDLLEAGEIHLEKLEPTSRVAARYDVVAGKPTVFLQRGEFGLTAIHLFHEMVHALDDEFASRLFEAGARTDDQRRTWLFEAEKLAYTAQQALVEELSGMASCVSTYLHHHEQRAEVIAHPLTDAQIKYLYW